MRRRSGAPPTAAPRPSPTCARPPSRPLPIRASSSPSCTACSRSMRPCWLRGSRRSPDSSSSAPRRTSPTSSTRSTRASATRPPAASVKATVKYRYAAKNTTQTVYVTVKGAEGQPLEGVRVDIAFPKGTGGTTLLRRYTTRAGTVAAYGAIGASPYGVRRDVVVTVKTGDVVKTATTWFTTSRRLAAGSAGFKSWVNDTTVYPGQIVRVGSIARDRLGRPVPNLKDHLDLDIRRRPVVRDEPATRAPGQGITRCRSRTRRRGVWSRSWQRGPVGQRQPHLEHELPPPSPGRRCRFEDGRDGGDSVAMGGPSGFRSLSVPRDSLPRRSVMTLDATRLRRSDVAPVPACCSDRSPGRIDTADLVLEVLELRRGADLVRGELLERLGRQVAPAGVADQHLDPASRARWSQGRTRSASRASYQQSPARTTSTSGGASSRTSCWRIATRWPLARALRPHAATANGSMSAAVTAVAPAPIAAIAHRPEPDARSNTRRPATASGWSRR